MKKVDLWSFFANGMGEKSTFLVSVDYRVFFFYTNVRENKRYSSEYEVYA